MSSFSLFSAEKGHDVRDGNVIFFYRHYEKKHWKVLLLFSVFHDVTSERTHTARNVFKLSSFESELTFWHNNFKSLGDEDETWRWIRLMMRMRVRAGMERVRKVFFSNEFHLFSISWQDHNSLENIINYDDLSTISSSFCLVMKVNSILSDVLTYHGKVAMFDIQIWWKNITFHQFE